MTSAKKTSLLGLCACYFPFGLSLAVGTNTPEAWWISWIGSWFIFYMVLTGRVFEVVSGGKLSDQVLKPWFLVHLIYAGYGFMTSIFYFMDLNGWYYLSPNSGSLTDIGEISRASQAQVYYSLAHAALVTGFTICRRPRASKISELNTHFSLPAVLIMASSLAFLCSLVIRLVPGIDQIAVKLSSISVMAGASSIGAAILTRSLKWLPLAVLLNGVMLVFSIASAMKEETIVLILINALAFYPMRPRLTGTLTILVLAVGFVILPSISNTLRRETWVGSNSTKEAIPLAFRELAEKDRLTIAEETWTFLVYRLSEQSMFTEFLKSTPHITPYYDLTIAKQSLINLVPRIFWPQKPDTERLVMGRVYNNGVISETSGASAKPAFVVDGYLSKGALGVWLSGIVFGALAQLCSRQCEGWFGGYTLGGVLFNGLFSIMWRGNCWEFFLNSVLWSFFVAWVLQWLGHALGWLKLGRVDLLKYLDRQQTRDIVRLQ
jgi:hypothetical protein